MSYKLTEAGRKHIATIEDTKMYLVKKNVEGATPDIDLHIEDADKLNLQVKLPSYCFEVDEVDDRFSRIRFTDRSSPENDNTITFDGFDHKGLGWRYTISFTKDQDNYVNGIVLTNLNNGDRKELTFKSLTTLNVKSLTVDNDLAVDGNLAVAGTSEFNDDVTISKDSDEAPANLNVEGTVTSEVVNAKTVKAAKTNTNNLTAKAATVTGNFVVDSGDSTEKADAEFRNTDVAFSNGSLKTDETTSVDLNTAKVGTFTVDTENVKSQRVEDSEIERLTVSERLSVGDFSTNTISAVDAQIEHIVSRREDGTGRVSTDNLTADNAVIGTETVKTSSIEEATVESATITKVGAVNVNTKNLSVSRLATINKEEVKDSAIDQALIDTADIKNLNVSSGTVTFTETGAIISEVGDMLEVGNKKDELVLVSKGIGGKNDPDHYNIKARVDDKEVVLLTGDDAKALGLDNVVDRSTNQEIAGVKKFNSALFANDGIYGRDQDFKEFNIISRGPDINDVADPDELYEPNPVYVQAEKDAKGYEEAKEAYADVKAKKSVATIRYTELSRAEADANKAEATYEDKVLEFGAYQAAAKAIGDGIRESEKKYDAAEKKVEEELKAKIKAYSGEGITEELTEENFKAIDAVYEAARAKLEVNDTAQTYLARLKEAFNATRLASLVSSISAYAREHSIEEHNNNKYESIDSLSKLVEVCRLYESTNDPLLKAFDVYIKAVAADPTLESLGTYTSTSSDGLYKNDGTFTLVVTLEGTINTKVMFHNIVGGNFQHTNTGAIKKWTDTEESSTAIDVATDLVSAYDAATAALYSIPADVNEMWTAKNAYVTFKESATYANVVATVEDSHNGILVEQCEFVKTSDDDYTFRETYDEAKRIEADLLGRIETYYYDVDSDNVGEDTLLKLKAENAQTGSVIDNAKVEKEAKATIKDDAESALAKALTEFNDAATTYVALDEKFIGNSAFGEPLSGNTYPADLEELKLYAPIAPNSYEQFVAGSINKVILKPGVDTVMTVGNDGDELHLRSDGIEPEEDGAAKDEHILATINGHLHKIANLDDITDTLDNGSLESLDGTILSTKVGYDKEEELAKVSVNSVIKTKYTEAELAEFAEKGELPHPTVTKDVDKKIFGVKGSDGISVGVEGDDIKLSLDDALLSDVKITSKKDIDVTTSEDGKEVNVDLKNVYERDLVGKEEVIEAYGKLAASKENTDNLPTAVAVKVLTDNALEEALDAKKTIALRVPAAPKNTGSYMLKATVSSDGENMSSVYSWDGSVSLPDTGEDAVDDLGDKLEVCTVENPVEYGLKLRIVNEVQEFADGSYKVNRVPQFVWTKIK